VKPTITVIFSDGTKREFKQATLQLDWGFVTVADSDGQENSFPSDLVAEVIREPMRRF
jgi:hypothetical protein